MKLHHLSRTALLACAVIAGGMGVASASLTATTSGMWNQIGADIEGEAQFDDSGGAIALSSDGRSVAIGAMRNSANGTRSGHVRVFDYRDTGWEQFGADIDGEFAHDVAGQTVALSSDGSILALGGVPDRTGYRGLVRVFERAGEMWVQVGSNLEGEALSDYFGSAIALSDDGQTLAVGAPVNDGNGTDAGHVRVFERVDNEWVQVGSDIDGESARDESGVGVALSADGKIVAIGAIRSTTDAFSVGQVRVFANTDGEWVQRGGGIHGESELDELGRSVDLSADGNTLAISAPRTGMEAGSVQVHQWSGSSWEQIGEDLQSEAAGDGFGASVALSADGVTLAVGAPFNDGGSPGAGHVRVYERVIDTWLQVGTDLDGVARNDRVGTSVALSADGQTLAFGAPTPGAAAGYVRVHGLSGVKCDGLTATIVGTPGNDVLLGTPGVDVIAGLQGDDILRGAAGNDVICGGRGRDVIFGGQGFDVMFGAQGNDIIYFADGQLPSERIDTAGGRAYAGAGNDDVYGSQRWDRMQGGRGSDRLFGYGGRDWIRAGSGTDTVVGGSNIDSVHGGNGNDLVVVDGNDEVRGGAGRTDECVIAAGSNPLLISCEVITSR